MHNDTPDARAELDPAAERPLDDEPEPTAESDIPSDGRDPIGEAMIRDLPQRTGQPESQPVSDAARKGS